MSRYRAAVVAVMLLASVTSACGDDSPFASTSAATTTTAIEPTTTTSTTTAPTTTEAPTTTTTTTPTTTAPPVACPGAGTGPIPGGATDISFQTALLDGDALPDVFSTYQVSGTWHLHADLGTGYGTDLSLDAAWLAAHYTHSIGMVQVQAAKSVGDPREVAVVRLLAGLGQAYGMFAIEGCAIVPLTLGSGLLPDLWQAMGPAHSDFPVCGPGPSVLQVVFGLTAGCSQLSTCPNPTIAITEYQVARDPARLTLIGDTSRASTHAEWLDMNSRSCWNP